MAAASGRGAVAEEEEGFSERELEVAAILADLPSIVRAERRRHRRLEKQQLARPEIPTWGRRRPRKAPAVSAAAVEKPAAAIVAAPPPAAAAAADEDDDRHNRRDGAASPDTPLAFPADDHEEDDYEDRKKAAAHDEWVHHQRGAVASLSHENAHLVKIEEFRARLETSRSTHDSLSLMHQSKHKKRNRPEEEEEERRWKLRACAERPALDLNEPAEADAEDAKPQALAAQQQWCHRGYQLQQLVQQKAAATAAARRRRREIRRAKASAGSSRTRRLG